jgi:DNA repair protein RadA/Sms
MVPGVGRHRTVHTCKTCGSSAPRWTGRCATCGEWNSLVEEEAPGLADAAGSNRRSGERLRPDVGPLLLADVDPDASIPFSTGLGEVDRVLAGGLVPGSVTLIGGEPGIGKSTLVLQALSAIAAAGRTVLLVAAEESAEQVRRRAARLGALDGQCYVVGTTELPAALEAVARVKPHVVVVDSIQTVADPLLASPAGSTSQVRECAGALADLAKASGISVVLVGHVTKDGSLAGPRTLEHLVDTVLTFEGDRHHTLRLLAATKHRFGPTGEIGLFEMTEEGLTGLDDPSRLLLADRAAPAPGTVIVPVAEGRRPLLVEMQALTTAAHGGAPRRVVEGVSAARASLMLAVVERCLGMPTGVVDVFVSTVGGIRVTEPATDLGLALCIVSALGGRPVPADTVVFGELGLTGELRHTPRAERRLAEAHRLGFRRAIVPKGTPRGPADLEVHPVEGLVEAATMVDLVGSVLESSRKALAAGSSCFSGKEPRSRLASA